MRDKEENYRKNQRLYKQNCEKVTLKFFDFH